MALRGILVAAVFVLAGCATQIMQGYIGKPIQEAMVDYGAPAAKIEMPDGTTAYQWAFSTTTQTPITATTQNYGNGITTTNVMGGQTYTSNCLYTLFARRRADGVEIVESFKKPSMMCQ